MKYGQLPTWVAMDAYLHLDVVVVILIRRDLKDQSTETYIVVVDDRTLILFAENVLNRRLRPRCHSLSAGILPKNFKGNVRRFGANVSDVHGL
jgi:hypothetical protein